MESVISPKPIPLLTLPEFPAGFFYVQDERYAVGAGMRRSGVRPFRFARQLNRMCGTSRVSTWMCDAKPLSVARHNHERYAVGAGMRRSGVRPFRFARQLNRMCGYAQDVRYIARSTWMCGYAQDVRYIARSTWMCGAIVSVSHSIPIVRCDCS
jgi:hypothetical protein